ncbi:MAG TPA: dephospho-CoA kinase [Gemmatimonadales bacterium]|nr:dephospho-CoA kinase [Gemmatimonadales bacterium]
MNIGLTGNIAAGKSSVSGLFRRWGATILDADELARDAEAPGSVVLAAIVKRFGKGVLAPDGSLDRPALRSKVMGDDAALAGLNAIVHPAVRARRDELQQEARRRGDLMVVNDIPLLFEALDPALFDVIVLVDAPLAVRRTRLRALRGLGNDEADRMLAAQMPAERKRERSQHVIENDGDLARLEKRARVVFDELRRRAAAQAAGRAGRVLVLASVDAKDEAADLDAVAARYQDAQAVVRRVSGKAPVIRKALQPDAPAAIVATPAAAAGAREAWLAAGSPGDLLTLGGDPDPLAVRLDLRPWGRDRALLGADDASGHAPRDDVFPALNPLP